MLVIISGGGLVIISTSAGPVIISASIIIIIYIIIMISLDRPSIHARVHFTITITEVSPNITVTESIATAAILPTITVRIVIQSFTDWIKCLRNIIGIRDTCCARVHLSAAEFTFSCTAANFFGYFIRAIISTITVVSVIQSLTDWISYCPFILIILIFRDAFKLFRLGLGRL